MSDYRLLIIESVVQVHSVIVLMIGWLFELMETQWLSNPVVTIPTKDFFYLSLCL